MLVKELKRLLEDIDENAEVTVCNDEQDYCYNLAEVRTCEDHASEYYKKYADLIIEPITEDEE